MVRLVPLAAEVGWAEFMAWIVALEALPNLQPQARYRHLRKGLVTADHGGVHGHSMGGNHHVEIAQVDPLSFQRAAPQKEAASNALVSRRLSPA